MKTFLLSLPLLIIAVGIGRVLQREMSSDSTETMQRHLLRLRSLHAGLERELITLRESRVGKERTKFFAEDLPTIFNVKLNHAVRIHPDITEVYDQWDLETDARFTDDLAESKRIIDLYASYIDSAAMPDRRMYVKWAGAKYGYGLFANVNLKANTFLSAYGGVLTKNKRNTDYMWNYATEAQVRNITLDLGIDARFEGNLMRFSNHDDEPNVKTLFVPFNNIWHLSYVTNRDIWKDEQIFVSYGNSYWNARTKVDDQQVEQEPQTETPASA